MRFNRRLRRAPPAALRMGGISVVVVVLSCAASRRLSVSPAAPSVTAAAAATGAGGGISCSARSFARRAPRPRAPCVALRTRLPVSPRPDPRPEARTGAGCCLDAPLSRAAVELGHVDCAAAGCGGAAEGSGGAAIRSRYCLANASPYATSCEQPPHSKVTLGSAHKPIISYTHQHPRTIRKNVYCGSWLVPLASLVARDRTSCSLIPAFIYLLHYELRVTACPLNFCLSYKHLGCCLSSKRCCLSSKQFFVFSTIFDSCVLRGKADDDDIFLIANIATAVCVHHRPRFTLF